MKHAYQVLGVPLSATPTSIKQAYRQLVKRWHPDLYKSGTEEYADATLMTKSINESYSLIEDAPLRYHADAYSPAYAAARQAARGGSKDPGYPKVDSILRFTWFEFWVRFVVGAIWGAAFGFRLGLYPYSNPHFFVPGIVFSSVAWAFIVAFACDGFWHSFFGRWWMWW